MPHQGFTRAVEIFIFGCLLELALLGIAALLASWFERPILEHLFWRETDVLWGFTATLAMLASFRWTLKSPVRWAAELRKTLELVLRPMLSQWSLPQIAVISILAGICEEILFRGVLQRGLSDVAGTWPALVISSVVFGFAHPLSKGYIASATAMGFLLGGLFLLTGNLLGPILAHGLYDFCALTWFLRLRRGDPR